MAYEVAVRLKTFPFTKEKATQYEEYCTQSDQESEIILFPLLEIPKRTNLDNCNIYADDRDQPHADSLTVN